MIILNHLGPSRVGPWLDKRVLVRQKDVIYWLTEHLHPLIQIFRVRPNVSDGVVVSRVVIVINEVLIPAIVSLRVSC